MAFLRFVVQERNRQSGFRYGFLRGAEVIRRRGSLSVHEDQRLSEIFEWFNRRLPVPSKYSRTRNASHKVSRCLAWFKDSASDHIALAREVAELLRQHDLVVETILTERPGFIVYDDEFQVVAEPFSETPT
jgi:hypothetical protein